MKHTKPSELRTKSVEDLNNALAKERAHFRDLSFRLAGAQLKNIGEINETRRSIARILTVISEKKKNES